MGEETCIQNNVKFQVETAIDEDTVLSKLVTVYKDTKGNIDTASYDNKSISYCKSTMPTKSVLGCYKDYELLSVSTIVDDELVTVWKDGSIL